MGTVSFGPFGGGEIAALDDGSHEAKTGQHGAGFLHSIAADVEVAGHGFVCGAEIAAGAEISGCSIDSRDAHDK